MKKFSFFFLSALSAALVPMHAAAQLVPAASAPVLPPGLYVQVIDGLINVSNKGGSTNFAPGQFGFTPTPSQAPITLPKNPGIPFTPPVAFTRPPVSGSSAPPKSSGVDCEVR
ncbi:UNVERIFIED_ORG: hypothetical protein ABIC43_003277 [Variovorax guangxiensis]